MAYDVNYKDARFTDIENDKKLAMAETNGAIDRMISETDGYFKAQIDAANDYANTQMNLQNQQTDFAIEQINQQKDQAHKDFLKEQSAANIDYQKQVDPYGVNAEQMAANGLTNSGYAESSNVAMYVAYQNRVATAKEGYNEAVLNYNNAIKEARLQNSSILAEIAYNTLQTRLSLSLEGFQYKNSLIMDKLDRKAQIEDRYYARYQDTLAQINTENALAWEREQFDRSLAWEREQYDRKLQEEQRQYNAKLQEEQRQFNAQYGNTSVGGGLILNQNGNQGQSPQGVLNQQAQAHQQLFQSLTSGNATSVPKISSFKEAKTYLKDNNKTTAVKDLMSLAEWNVKYLMGTLPDKYQYCPSYNDYLQAYVEWAMMNS